MTIAHAERVTTLSSIWVELTGKCQLECLHCYAGSSPDGTHGTMTAEQWETVLDDAAALGVRFVCFIGGEPTMHPDLPRLVRRALSLHMEVEVFSNLVRVTPQLWDLFETPGVRLATSWYSDDRLEHKQITGRDTHRQTLGNIEEAVRRGIPLRAGVIDGILPGQRFEEGNEMLRAAGVTSIGGDHLREFGRGKTPDPSQACGNCGNRRAAVLPDGSVTPCPLTRWMTAGDVRDSPLGDLVGVMTEQAATLPNWRGAVCNPAHDCPPYVCVPDCGPNRGAMNDCAPHRDLQDACPPDFECQPDRKACKPREATEVSPPCHPDSGCAPDYCAPDCRPSAVTDCTPGCTPMCSPNTCKPAWPECAPDNSVPVTACEPHIDCAPDHRCYPDKCNPDLPVAVTQSACRPDFVCGPAHCVP